MYWRNTRIHLVLGSGGIRCLSYVGAFRALAERNVDVASVSACSAGTLLGALLCTPGLDLDEVEARLVEADLEAMAGPPRWPGLLSPLQFFRWPFARYAASGLGRAYEQLAGGSFTLGDLSFRGRPVEFTTAAVDVDHDRILVYASSTHGAMSVQEAVDIAVAAPTLYPPVVARGRTLIDAVVFSELPVWLAAGLDEALPIVALHLKPLPQRAEAANDNVASFVFDAFISAVRSRDTYFTRQLPRVHVAEIDAHEWTADAFRLTEAERYTLIQRGYDAAAALLDRLPPRAAPTPSLDFTYSADPHTRAEQRAAELITRFQRKLGRMQRERAFISYSHRDRRWLERLQAQLAPLQSSDVAVWDDRAIAPGERWENEIREALAQAKVVVLLVSEAFLNSAYVREEELPQIVRMAEREGVRLLWIPLDEAGLRQPFLAPFQALTPPLDGLDAAAADDHLRAAAARVAEALADG